MVIGRASKNEGESEILIIGLSKLNVARLLSGSPIFMNRKTHGVGLPEGLEICIMYGETEEAMTKQMAEVGLITPDTQIHEEPKLGRLDGAS